MSLSSSVYRTLLRRLHQTTERNHPEPKPVSLAYASYESTKSVSGAGEPPLVVVHGLFGSKNNWNSLGKAMHRRTYPQRKIVAVDARNHGDSPHDRNHSYRDLALDIRKLMQDLSIPKAALLGHSMGGRAVMMMALTNPDLVERLIVADISPVSASSSAAQTQKYIKAMRDVVVQKDVPLSQARRIADAELSKTVADKGLRAFLLTNLVRKSDGSYAWRLNLNALNANLSNITAFPRIENLTYDGPTLFVTGGLSDMVQKQDHPEIRRLFPQVEIKTVEGAGHWLHSEKPEQFLEIVLQFLNKSHPVRTA